MPSSLPVVNVRITQAQRALLQELADLEGRSVASYLRQLLDQATPMLEAMLPVYRAAAKQAEIQPQLIKEAVRDALAGVEAQRSQLNLLELMAGTTAQSANDPSEGADRPERSEGAPAPSKRSRKA